MNQLNHILIYIVQLNCIIPLLESGYRYLEAIFQGLCGVFVLSHLIIGSSFLVKILFHICIHGHFSTKIYVFKEEKTSQKNYADILEFEVSKKQWTSVGKMSTSRSGHAISAVYFDQFKKHCIT